MRRILLALLILLGIAPALQAQLLSGGAFVMRLTEVPSDPQTGAPITPTFATPVVLRNGSVDTNVTGRTVTTIDGTNGVFLITASGTVPTSATWTAGDIIDSYVVYTYNGQSKAVWAQREKYDVTVNSVYARIGTNGAGLTAIGDTRMANLDAAVSSRSTFSGGLLAVNYTAPDNTNIAATLAAAQQLVTTIGTAGANLTNVGGLSSAGNQAIWDKATSGLTASGSIGKALVAVNDIVSADRYIVKTTAPNPYKLRLIKAGSGTVDTGTVLLEQELRDVNGTAIRNMTTAFGQSKAP